jgi:hypothetical protein
MSPGRGEARNLKKKPFLSLTIKTWDQKPRRARKLKPRVQLELQRDLRAQERGRI